MPSSQRQRCASTRPVFAALLLALIASPSCWSKTILSPEALYGSEQGARECLFVAFNLTRIQMESYDEYMPDAASNCLRFAFHDAGTYRNTSDTGGANGSLMIEAELSEQPSMTGALCPGIIDSVVYEAKLYMNDEGVSVCENLTYADTIQIAGTVSVHLLSGGNLTCSCLMGRPDADVIDVVKRLPVQCLKTNALVTSFERMGFSDPEHALIVLSGAHTIGMSRATSESTCPFSRKTSGGTKDSIGTNLPLTLNPQVFDNSYYQEIVYKTGQKGFFQSDRALYNISAGATCSMRARMLEYATNASAFLGDWCRFYKEMGMLGVDPAPAGYTIADGWDPLSM